MKRSPSSTMTPAPEAAEHEQSMVMLLGAAQSVHDRLEAALAEVGLTPAKYQAIDELARAGEPLTLSDFASRLHCVRSNITQLVDRLEADGLVRRVDDPADRRAIRAVITPSGLERRTVGAEVVRRLEDEIASRVPESERALLHRVLAALK